MSGDRVVGIDRAAAIAAAARRHGRRVVFTNGCFDLLHAGHLDCLEAAAAAGDLLVVAVNDDASVARLKGTGRPILPGPERADLLAALAVVDVVFLFDDDTLLEAIRRIRPDCLVKGGDWKPEEVVGGPDVAGWGGEVRIVPRRSDRSTGAIVAAIRQRFGAGGSNG